ncbi:MAG: hypothetical protein ACTSRG_07275 [Candidatus Helarchaeota archaeon]
MTKTKKLASFLLIATFGALIVGFIPKGLFMNSKNTPLYNLPNLWNSPITNGPGNPSNPTNPGDLDLETLAQYNPSDYTGTGASYSAREDFEEIVEYANSLTWSGSNVQINIDTGYPSQSATRLYGTISTLKEHHAAAYNAQFTGTSADGFTTYTNPQGDDGVDTSVTHPTDYYRMGFQGHTSSVSDARFGNDIYFSGSGWSRTVRNLGQYWDTGGFANPDIVVPEGYQSGYWRNYAKTTGTTDHDIWTGNTYHAEDAAVNWIMENDNTFTHGLDFSASDSGYSLTQARVHLNYNIHSGDFDDPNNNYRLAIRYQKNGAWSGWHIVTEGTTVTSDADANYYWDIKSAVSGSSPTTTWKLAFRFTANLYSSNGGDPEEIYCDIDDLWITIDYDVAEEFNTGTNAGIQSATYAQYDKDTINGNLTFQYRGSNLWSSTSANSRAAFRIYMSHSAQNGGSSRYVYDIPLTGLTMDDGWHTRVVDITADLGLSGQIDDFYFKFEVYWSIGGTGQWGPMTTGLLSFDLNYIQFNFDANVRPDNVGLYMINNADLEEYTINGGYGAGVIDWTKNWAAGSNPTFDLKINSTWVTGSVASYITQADVEIGYTDLNMTEYRILTAATSTFEISTNSTNVYWYLSYTTCAKTDSRTDGSEVITITGLPTDYTGSSVSPNSNGEHVISAPSGTLKVSGSTSSTAYTLTATAPNYLLNALSAGNIRCMENGTDSGVWQDTSVIYPTNWTKVRMDTQAAGYVNMTIVNASRTGVESTWGFGIEYQELLTASSPVNSTPWQIPLDSIPGVWTIIVAYNNSLNSASLNEVGLVSIPLDMRRKTYQTGVIFSQADSGRMGDGSDPNQPANVTVDGDPLYINITWIDRHWGTPVTYYQKANITISSDNDLYPDDKGPFGTKELQMTRDGGTFFYKITADDYGTPTNPGWCYTGTHTFTIELFSDSTEINGSYESVQIQGSFQVLVDIYIEAWEPSALPNVDEYTQGAEFQPTLVVRDVSHNKDINNVSADYQGLVTVNWTLVFGDNITEKNEIISRWNTRTNGSLTQVVGGVFRDDLLIDPACEPTDDSATQPWYIKYYYFNFSVYIQSNTTLDWTFEKVWYMNASAQERMVGTPYEKPEWVKIAVIESSLTLKTDAKTSFARDPYEKTDIDVYWYDWDMDTLIIYVKYYSSVDNTTEQETGLVSGTGFVNSTYYNTSISQREGNVTDLRATFTKRGWDGDIYIESEASGALWTSDKWEEAIPYRWQGDSGGHYDLVPEINTTTGYFTGNLIPWDINNNLTWGWYYKNFTVHESFTGNYFIRITASKLEKYWYNSTEIGGADKYKFAPAREDVIVNVQENPVVLSQRNGGTLIPDYPTENTYYWNDTLTLNLTAWDALNNGTVTPEHPNGVWNVSNFNLEFNLIDRNDPLNPINESVNIPEAVPGRYEFAYRTYPLDGEKQYRFKITGELQNYTIDDDGSPPIIPQRELDFDLKERPTTLTGIHIKGVMSGVEELDNILDINQNLNLDITSLQKIYYIPKNRIFTMSVRFADDTRNINQSINDANTWINVTKGGAEVLIGETWEDYLANNGDGVYNFTVNTTGLLVGEKYRITVSANRSYTGPNNYKIYVFDPATRYFDLEIKPIPVVMEAANQPVVTQGGLMFILLHVYDPTASGSYPRELPGAIIQYEIKGPGINMLIPLRGYMIEVGNGLYLTALDTWTSLFTFNTPGSYIFEARLLGFQKSFDPEEAYGTYLDYDTAAMLSSQGTQEFLFVNSAGPFGPLTSSMLLGLIGAVVVAGSYMTYHSIKILRVPYALRMIEDTTKKIKRRRKTHAGIMKSREQQIVEEAETKLSMLGVKLEPISAKKLPPPITKVVKKTDAEKHLPALTEDQIKAELDAIPDLSAEEKMLFLKEIKGLSSSDQREFIAGLKGEPKEDKQKKP